MTKQIRIECKGAIELDLFLLKEFQGDLKTLTTDNFERLRTEILTDGYSFTVHVWNSEGQWYILDGHQRVRVLKHLVQKEGYECPPLPCSIVIAKSYKEAKKKLLAAASAYGKVEDLGLGQFISDIDMDLEELRERYNFHEFNLDNYLAANVDSVIADHDDEEPLSFNNNGVEINEKELDENIATHQECPSCGYKW
jgi:ParB-like chromosome segregation protein Spo0J